METLHIENFAGLENVRIEVAPITVLIGPQATGKSVISKLLYFFREVLHGLSPLAGLDEEPPSAATYRDACKDKFARYFPPSTWGTGDLKITYQTADQPLTVTISHEGDGPAENLHLTWSAFFDEWIEDFRSAILDARSAILDELTAETEGAGYTSAQSNTAISFWFRLTEKLGNSQLFDPQFIPAGRSFFSQMQASIFRSLEAGADIDPFLVSFGATLERTRGLLRSYGFYGKALRPLPKALAEGFSRQMPMVRNTFARILRAELEETSKVETLRFPDGCISRLAHSSSGQQEVVPLLLLLARFTLRPAGASVALHIEEPEAHLFPATQRDVIETISEVFGLQEGKMSLVITTHSPYILTAFNNLLQAGLRYRDASESVAKKLEDIVPRSRALEPGSLTAYLLQKGEATCIIDSETHLIDAKIIDSVSDDLAVQFDQLLWTE